jgi:hypothetical protein
LDAEGFDAKSCGAAAPLTGGQPIGARIGCPVLRVAMWPLTEGAAWVRGVVASLDIGGGVCLR